MPNARCKKIVLITEELSSWYGEKYGKFANKFYVAADGADPIDCNIKKNTSRISLGYVGHFYKGKGLEIISKLPEIYPNLDFYIVGGYS